MWEAFRSRLSRIRDLLRTRKQAAPPPARTGLGIVALVTGERDRKVLSRLAAEHSWTLHLAATCAEAVRLLEESRSPIVLCDRELPGSDWREVIQQIASSPHPVYTILVSRVADDYLWNEVIRQGGHDLLAAPLHDEEVRRAIRLGWSYWNNSMQAPPAPLKHLSKR